MNTSTQTPIINPDDIKCTLTKQINNVFPINYTKKELECIRKIQITNGNVFSHFGKIGNINPSKFIQEIGKNTQTVANTFTTLVNKMVDAVCNGYDKDHAWIDIKATKPNDRFNIPRWHMDGSFFTETPEDRKQIQSKFVAIFKGPGTLMVNSTLKDKEKMDDIMRANGPKTQEDFMKYLNDEQWRMNIRMKQNAIFARKKVKQLQNDEGLIFIVGNTEKALIHSEPPMTEERIFISILPGTEKQIENLKKKWKR